MILERYTSQYNTEWIGIFFLICKFSKVDSLRGQRCRDKQCLVPSVKLREMLSFEIKFIRDLKYSKVPWQNLDRHSCKKKANKRGNGHLWMSGCVKHCVGRFDICSGANTWSLATNRQHKLALPFDSCMLSGWLHMKVCLANNSDLKKRNKQEQVLSGRAPRQPPGLFSHTWFYKTDRKGPVLAGLCLLIYPQPHGTWVRQ